MTLKEFKNLSNEELIDLFKNFGYSAKNINDAFEFSRNTTERLFDKRGIDRSRLIEEHKKQIIESYEQNPKLCKHCGSPIPWEKRENEYCCRSCAVSENNKRVVRNKIGNIANLCKTNPFIGNPKYSTKEEMLKQRAQTKHNRIIKNHYLDIPEIGLGCCFICGEENCVNEFCTKHNFSQLIGLSKRYGLDAKSIGTPKIFNEFYRIRDLLYDFYWNKGMSGNDLADYFKVPYTSIICHDFKILGIPKRTFEESSRNSVLQGKWEVPEIVDETGLSKNIQQGWHTTWTGEEVFLRSSYELDYAEYLDSNQISYLVEEHRIEYFDSQQNKTRVAIPDFYISSTNEIVEIKSDFTLDIQEMLDKFKAYKNLGYIPKLILEGKEVDIYNIEEEVGEKRLEKIKYKNLKSIIKNNENSEEIDTDKQN